MAEQKKETGGRVVITHDDGSITKFYAKEIKLDVNHLNRDIASWISLSCVNVEEFKPHKTKKDNALFALDEDSVNKLKDLFVKVENIEKYISRRDDITKD